ncbi:MAG: hypothetical protein RBT46_02390 [Weeksellaceae bacterium]|nr:hypothetical protein [Weeksellaceae bacterium]MDX9704538.1 hypothetical protein [Weeksellaceae bacterium]
MFLIPIWEFQLLLLGILNANSKKEYKRINSSQNPVFRAILFYGKTDNYDYYVLLNFDGELPENYISNDTIIGGNLYTLVASKSIHQNDFNYLKTHFYSIETDLTEKVCF